ncbi:hypothetical protein [uncultured Pedobacter sp.]|uniref:hypothetical protein n=1 Tax=uncultured Pedobacter sp. TaxID=246139 RepID=UPI0025DAC710|nr:hypothetical protein [uncultured Pedobacter sp.]
MMNCLYLICPTDHLETVINTVFKGRNYFYTSLGNNLPPDEHTIAQISAIIECNNIGRLTFILSERNRIVLDAVNDQNFIKITGLRNAYADLRRHQKITGNYPATSSSNALIISSYLHQKIKELQELLRNRFRTPLLIDGKLYSMKEKCFKPVYSDLLFLQTESLN